jgi:S1-C subfamily serine protease
MHRNGWCHWPRRDFAEKGRTMRRTFTTKTMAAALGAAALAGAGGGAAIYAATGGTSHSTSTVTVAAPASASPVASTSALSVGEIYRRDAGGVVEITVTTSGSGSGGQTFPFGGQSPQSKAQGSGFVYDTSGHVITNDHVVAGASSIDVAFADGSSYKATVVGSDPSTDVAVLHVDAPASELHPIALASSSSVAVGDGVVAIGAPFGLVETVTSGIVSALGREIQAPNDATITDTIQTDAAINHGNSGGPLLNLQGRVIGITSQIESDSGGNDGVGFAVASNTVKRIADALVAHGKVAHALLGVEVQTLPPSAASTLGETAGVAVAKVEAGSAAAKAGLRAGTGTKTVAGRSYPTGGDVITKLDGTRVTSDSQLRALIDERTPGQTVKLTVVRGGKTRTVTATLGSR